MKTEIESAVFTKLNTRINRKDWWHVPPQDPLAYKKRGKFYASTYKEAEFWGRPLIMPQKVSVYNPLVGDEAAVETVLFGQPVPDVTDSNLDTIEWRFELDAKMKDEALKKGYDAIVIFSPQGFARMKSTGNLPLSLELNILEP